LVSVHLDENTGDLTLHVEPRTARSRYTAIWHVWVDGLGNPHENSLPGCQLLHLRSIIRSLPEAVENAPTTVGKLQWDHPRLAFSKKENRFGHVFWMDTLCIPVKDEQAALRAQSINDMASTYAVAVNVVVHDSELQSTTTKGVPAGELLARILSFKGLYQTN
jgi:hypothetical protein